MREAPRLAEMRLQALEARIEADLHLGRAADVVAELQRLTGAHPLREHLHAQLMLAFYRTSRQCEALAAYQNARRLLIEELGTEPGIELRELHQRILTGDAGLTAPAASPPRRAAPRSCRASCPPPFRISPAGRRTSGADTSAGPGWRRDAGNGGDLGHRRDGRGGQDRAGRVLGPSDRASFPGWAAVREPARVRSVRRAHDTRTGDMQVPGRARSASRPDTSGSGRPGLPVPQRTGRPADADRAGQRPGCRSGAPLAARQRGMPGGGDQPEPADRAGRHGGSTPAESRRALRGRGT